MSSGSVTSQPGPTWMSPEPHPFHHAATAPAIACGWCPGWREVRCAEPDCRDFEDSGQTLPTVYRDFDGLTRCWTHRLGAEPLSLGLSA